jgi:HTH-type transcriptional regulator/antitoxin HigA
LKTERDYNTALKRADEIFDAKQNTPKGEELSLLVIKDYEDKHHRVPLPNTLKSIRMKMDELGMKNKDLEKYLGSKSYVSQILSGNKPLSAEVMRVLHRKLGIPASILLAA